ncbi:hypothetical protein [Bradyrhizobium sp. RD5-C2]|uniref:DUF6894 family protein n=1 Tax=Bradyrhizobium sp. RD5-C2 TaxID=244562 RepID=UPI001CC68041|nr:hypothetical protein [Bradyrhizobium sp. RD5-C2]
MRRYFFDLRDEQGVVSDDEGMLFSTLEAVQDEAARALGDFARDEVRRVSPDGGSARQLTIEVRDEVGAVMHATFSFEIKRLQ